LARVRGSGPPALEVDDLGAIAQPVQVVRPPGHHVSPLLEELRAVVGPAQRVADSVRRDPDAAKKRVARGRARAAEFSWKRSVDGLCGVFDEVLAEHRRGVDE